MRNVLRVLIAIVALAVVGCGGEKPTLVNVHGKVTYQGQPVPNLLLHFIPVEGRPGVAVTDANGDFSHVAYTRERKGLLIGEYAIVVQYLAPEPAAGEPRPATAPPAPPELHPLLEKYGRFESPELKQQVDADTKEIVLQLGN